MNFPNKYINRCLDLAHRGIGSTSPNPSVGAVIVDAQGRIIGEGWTSPYGGAHAEVNAINAVKSEDVPLLQTSTIYVTLEPCFHFGKTPPCVDLILRSKIPHVVVAYIDPFPEVAGKSIEKLRQNGVEVEVLVLTQRQVTPSSSLLPFFTNIAQKRPYIILKWAETADGFIGQSDKAIAISNVYVKRLVHKWRSEADAIMVGTETAALDNPELTNRYYYGKSPKRIVIDRQRRLSEKLHLFDGSIETFIYTEGGTSNAHFDNFHNFNYRFVAFDDNFLNTILADLYTQKIGILFVEGGARLLNTFITKGLWDEARVFVASKNPVIKNGIQAPKLPFDYLDRKVQIIDNQLLVFRNA
ncbi:MAG: bifunctional diaminohydroxyphosphoribosylaminopyrimidine deaminase/5-amino-6-(5-phosphoribosylamino)uracil reductase RibD [Saprospiraceae bacterium]|nr:bifunctional diaminohydroxyphosphoribosylaminopyrimidine deaminase/5-amino-6-(5-phosphoribosylamino)uracil reductase RibD [Saprospiraceae bacterium]